MEWDNPFLTNEYSGIGYHISFFYFFWGGVTWDLYANFLDQRGGVIFEGALSLNRSNMLRREWSSNRNCFFLVWGKRFKADWVIILGKEISPRTCMRENKWFLEESHSGSNLITPYYSNDSQPQPFLCPFFFLVTKAWRFCGAWDGDLPGNRYDNFEGLSMTIKSALTVGN